MQPTPVRVLVVDDQRPFRVAASAVLRRMPDFTLVGEAETGEDGVRAAAELRPDLVLMDVCLPGIDGVEWQSITPLTGDWSVRHAATSSAGPNDREC